MKVIQLKYCSTKHMVADVRTKALIDGEKSQELGENIRKEMKKDWATPLVGIVEELQKLDPLISSLIREHYTDIAANCRRLRRHCGDMRDRDDAMELAVCATYSSWKGLFEKTLV